MTTQPLAPFTPKQAKLCEELIKAGVGPDQMWVMVSPQDSHVGVAFVLGGLSTVNRDDTLLIELNNPRNTRRGAEVPGDDALPDWFQPLPGCSRELIAATSFLDQYRSGSVIPTEEWR